jgi:hypothetical protein
MRNACSTLRASTPCSTPITRTSSSEFLHPTRTPGKRCCGASEGQKMRISPCLREVIISSRVVCVVTISAYVQVCRKVYCEPLLRGYQNEPLLRSCSRADMPPSGARDSCESSDSVPTEGVFVCCSGLTSSDSCTAMRWMGMRNSRKRMDKTAKPLAARV